MTSHPNAHGLKTLRTRVYYAPDGTIIHIHRLVCPESDLLDEERVAAELSVVHESVLRDHETAESVDVEEADLIAMLTDGGRFSIDTKSKKLILRAADS